MNDDARRFAPAAARNRTAILEVLRTRLAALPGAALVLEIASGSGEHAVHFAAGLPDLVFQPSDPDPECRASIAAWREHSGLPNLLPPLDLDVTTDCATWPVAARGEPPRALLCSNMIHIAPWAACLGLIAGAGHWLGPGDPLVLYGPFRRGGSHTTASNEAFDASLRARDPGYGVRDLEAVRDEAHDRGLELTETIAMPANNLTIVLRRSR